MHQDADQTKHAHFLVRPYLPADRPGVRDIYGSDEFARPRLMQKYPGMQRYLADSMSYYPDYEPESLFVAEADGEIVGALLGAADTSRQQQIHRRCVRPLLMRRCLRGVYGWPGWLVPIVRTELARQPPRPQIDLQHYPAHLHIGVVPAWRRQGVGHALMACYSGYLRRRGVPGYHLYASSFHPLGIAFYHKLGLESLGQFAWYFHDGEKWLTVTEYIFGERLCPSGESVC